MLQGVTIEDPAQTAIDFGVRIGRDTVIRPFTVIERDSVIDDQCTVGPLQHLPAGSVIHKPG
jgi:bifunctional UDP-N-acetylglucosamine pyrophosphorylase/glucosamine-1-phosphate N-acetyltransferase